MQDLWRLSAAELATLISSKKVSAREAASAALARLDAVNPRINAVVDHRPEDVLTQADAAGRAGNGQYPPGHKLRGFDPLSRLCLRRSRLAADGGTHPGVQSGAAGTQHRRPDHRSVGSAGAYDRRSADRAGRDVGKRF